MECITERLFIQNTFPQISAAPAPLAMPYIELGQIKGVETQSVPISLDGLSPPIYVDFPYGEHLQSKVYVCSAITRFILILVSMKSLRCPVIKSRS